DQAHFTEHLARAQRRDGPGLCLLADADFDRARDNEERGVAVLTLGNDRIPSPELDGPHCCHLESGRHSSSVVGGMIGEQVQLQYVAGSERKNSTALTDAAEAWIERIGPTSGQRTEFVGIRGGGLT